MSDAHMPGGSQVTHEVNERDPFWVGLGYSLLVGIIGYGIAYLTHSAFESWAYDFFQWVSCISATVSTSVIISFMSFGIYARKETKSSLKAVGFNCLITLIVFFVTQNW